MKIRTLLILLVFSAVAGCDTIRPTQPSSGGNVLPPSSGGDVPPAPVSVRVEGRVLNGDRDGPVPGAVVTADRVSPGDLRISPVVSATADDQGRFSFTANLPSGWRELTMSVRGDGFEPNEVYVFPGDVTADLRLVPTLVIRPGESIEVSAFVNSPTPCFIESALCRRVIVEAPSGESVDLEVFPADKEGDVRLAGPLASQPYSIDEIGRRVTTSRGEVYIVPLSAVHTDVRSVFAQRVTLTAHRR